MSLLDVAGLCVDYGAIRAVREASLRVGDGESVAIVGPNGAGKSTLLNAVAGLLSPRSGTVMLAGENIAGDRPESVVRRGLALVPEGRHIFATLTVEENLRVAWTPTTERGRRDDLDEMFELFPPLAHARHDLAGGLSGGQQQQLAIARTLLTAPKVLMLDEPSIGLAPLIVDVVFDVLSRLRSDGIAILLVEQNMTKAIEFADRSYVMTGGNLSELDADGQSLAALGEAYLGVKSA